MSTEPTDEGKQHIDRWIAAREQLERAKSAENSASCEVSNSTNALGRWLCPDDAKDGESFCVWYGDSLILATKKRMNDYEVVVRKRGRRGLSRAA